MSLNDRLFCNHHAHPLRQAWSYRLRCAKEVFVWFKSRLNPWYISIPSNPNLYSTKIIMKKRWQTIASSVSIRTISPTATPLPTAYDCVAVYIAGRRTNLVIYGCRPTTKKTCCLLPCDSPIPFYTSLKAYPTFKLPWCKQIGADMADLLNPYLCKS